MTRVFPSLEIAVGREWLSQDRSRTVVSPGGTHITEVMTMWWATSARPSCEMS
ncbi:MAG: hypothetical protein ABR576_03125 [Thermoanaerobaculia bacterium]